MTTDPDPRARPAPPSREVLFVHAGRRYVVAVYGPPVDGACDVVVVALPGPHAVGRGVVGAALVPYTPDWPDSRRPLAHAAGRALGVPTRWSRGAADGGGASCSA